MFSIFKMDGVSPSAVYGLAIANYILCPNYIPIVLYGTFPTTLNV